MSEHTAILRGPSRGICSFFEARSIKGCMDVIAFPFPAWLRASSSPEIEQVVALLGDEARGLYRRNLAAEVRAGRREPPARAWRALDATALELCRRAAGQR